MSTLTLLSEHVPGRAFGPGSDEYDAGRTVFYGPGDPEAVVRPTTTAEVAAAVVAAVDAGVPITVRSGGHGSFPSTGGVVIDLAEFDEVTIGDGGLVTVGSGAHWGDVAAALAPHGLGISSGDTLDVGVGGLALGGGIGWLVRGYGLTVDLVRRVELVTAAGEVLTVDEASHPELFWALRGGGGNFGVVTRITLQAAEIGPIAGGHVHFDASDVPAVLRAWREVMRSGPDGLNSTLLVMPQLMPEMPPGPQLLVALQGSVDDLKGWLEPLLSLPSVVDVQLDEMAYHDLLEAAPPGPPPFRFAGGNGFLPELSDDVLAAIQAAIDREVPTVVMLRALGGEFSKVAPDATAIAYRDAELFLMVNGILPGDATDEQVEAAKAPADAAIAFTSGPYLNFTQELSERVIEASYPPETLARLKRVKSEVDPGNVFRPSHNITPG